MKSSDGKNGGIRLRRELSFWNLLIIGVVIVQPTAPMGIFGVVNNTAHGHVVTAILIAMVAMLFTAISYGKMARIYPSAGSAYTFVGKEIHPFLGYVTGWAMVMDYILNPLTCVAFSAKITMNLGTIPFVGASAQFYCWIVVYALLFTTLNLRGVRTSARLNQLLCAALTLVVIVYFFNTIRYIVDMPVYPKNFFLVPFYNASSFSFSNVFTGTSVAVLTYIGFDAISTMSEEAKNPRRDILRATVWVCLIVGALSAAEVYCAQLSWGPAQFPANQVESAFSLSAQKSGGVFLYQLLNIALLVATMGSGMGSQLAAGRMLYGMGNGNALPKKFFGKIDPVKQIPKNNIIFVGTIALLGAGALEISSSILNAGAYEIGAQMLNFGALLSFMGVNAATFTHYWLKSNHRKWINAVLPVLGFIVCLFIWFNLKLPAMVLGGTWLCAGLLYGYIRTNGFSSSLMTFEIPPEN
ncbi:MAG: APC family permease [Negativicutes bacterium]|jgi:amino acid transporter